MSGVRGELGIVGELDALAPASQLAAQAAAVVGDPLDPQLVAPTAGMAAAETLEALDDLMVRDLLRTCEDRKWLHFRHPIVRHLIYTSASVGWRASAHARIAAVLEQRHAPLLDRAHHVAQAAQPGDEDAISLLQTAAETALAHSPTTAAEWLSVAAQLLPAERAAAPRRLALLLSLAEARLRSGQLVASRATLTEAFSLVPPESPELRARVITAQARVERLLDRYPQVRASPRLDTEAVRGPRRLRQRTPRARGLSAREQEVAGLVTRGYSNQQIAKELVLSVRTVTTHVSHIFAKLGIASRGGLAIALNRQGSPADPG